AAPLVGGRKVRQHAHGIVEQVAAVVPNVLPAVRIVSGDEELILETREPRILQRGDELQAEISRRIDDGLDLDADRSRIAGDRDEREAAVCAPPMKVGNEVLARPVEAG